MSDKDRQALYRAGMEQLRAEKLAQKYQLAA